MAHAIQTPPRPAPPPPAKAPPCICTSLLGCCFCLAALGVGRGGLFLWCTPSLLLRARDCSFHVGASFSRAARCVSLRSVLSSWPLSRRCRVFGVAGSLRALCHSLPGHGSADPTPLQPFMLFPPQASPWLCFPEPSCCHFPAGQIASWCVLLLCFSGGGCIGLGSHGLVSCFVAPCFALVADPSCVHFAGELLPEFRGPWRSTPVNR